MKNFIVFLLIVWGISDVAYSQWSNDPANPMVVSSLSATDYNKSNVRIATTSDGTIYIAEEQRILFDEAKLKLSILDFNGNIKKTYIFSKMGEAIKFIENDFNLVASNNNLLLSVGGEMLFDLSNLTYGSFNVTTIEFPNIAENPIIAGTSVDINDAGEFVYAVPSLNNLYIAKLKPDGSMFLDDDIVIDGYNTMPKVCFIEDGSFYVVYRMDNRLFADYYDKNSKNVWKAIYVGHGTGYDLSHNEPHQIMPDGLGGIYVIWKKKNVYVQRITSEDNGFGITGVRKFSDYGMELTENTDECYNPIVSVDKLTNELNITWRTQTQNTNSVNLQKITPDGEKTWGTNGIIVDESILSHHNTPVAIGTAGKEKIMVVFSKYNTTSQNYDLVYNRYDIGTGNKDFVYNIDVNISKYKRNSIVATDFNHNQIVVAWSDSTNDEQVRTLAQNITYNGILGEDTLSIQNEEASVCSVFPLPANNEINIKYISKSTANATIQIFDYTGKLVFEDNSFVNVGENTITINRVFPAGEYNILLTTGSEKITLKVVFE